MIVVTLLSPSRLSSESAKKSGEKARSVSKPKMPPPIDPMHTPHTAGFLVSSMSDMEPLTAAP